jgi:S-adenosylmethionine:tRNA ribosyltransferase-isomerase
LADEFLVIPALMSATEQLTDYAYELPQHLVAQAPAVERSASRLLHMSRATDTLVDRQVRDLPSLLQPGDLLVVNDTRVLRARMYGRKASGGRIELLLERALDTHTALVQMRVNRKPKAGDALLLAAANDDPLNAAAEKMCTARVVGREGELFVVETERGWDDVLANCGALPLPPYIERAPGAEDENRYQTVFAEQPGAVAAPTAGLHFDAALLQALTSAGVSHASLTLHVGAGTFQPIRGSINAHVMHRERFVIDERLCAELRAVAARGGRVIAVGTTVVRALESVAQLQDADAASLRPCTDETQLFIRPGFRFRVVNGLMTNFHLPETTLMMLVSAFTDRERLLRAYRHAVQHEYRFFSYGDAMFIGD